jgi:hypothetical protein
MSNSNCTYCKAQIERVIQDRLALEALTSSPQEFTPQQLHDLRSTCNYVCAQCVVMDVKQELSATMTADCDVTSSSFEKAFLYGMQNQAKIEVEQNKARLQQLGNDLQTQQQIDNFSSNMVTTIRNIITTDTLNSLKQQAILMQELVIEPGSTSIVVQNLTQRLSLVMYASLVSSELTQARMQVAIDYATKSKVLQLQTQLDKAVSTSKEAVVTVYNLLGTVIKQIPAIFIVILCVIILAIFYYSFQNATRAMYVLDAQETLEKLHDL